MFSIWLIENKKTLQFLICEKLNYFENKEKYKDHVDLSVAISEIIAPNYALHLEIAVIIVEIGVDTLCQN